MFVLCTKRFGCDPGCCGSLVPKGASYLFLALFCLSTAPLALAYNEQFSFSTPVGSPYVPASLSGGDGTNNAARFYGPAGLCVGSATNLYVADGNVIRRISPVGTNWVMITLAGTPGVHAGDDGTNSTAKFDAPQGITIDTLGNLYVADTGNNAIRKVTPSGTNWIVTTIAGAGRQNNGSLDGTNAGARFNQPNGIAIDASGNLFVADTANNMIRKVTPVGTNWVVTTIAGTTNSGSANGTNTVARFNSPPALVADSGGNIYVSDYGNHTIRKATPSGTNWVVTTIAGSAGLSGSANGTNANARFNNPAGIALDIAGNLFVADSGNVGAGSVIRKLRASGTNWVVSTIAGLAGAFGNVDGVGDAARFDYAFGAAVDSGGTVYVTDQSAYTLRLGRIAIALQTTISANQLTLSWPSAASNYLLETKSSVIPGPLWIPLTSGISVLPDSFSLTTNVVSPSAFFRLHKP